MLKRIISKVSQCLAVVAVCASTFGTSTCAFAEETSYQALLEENQLVQDSTGKLHTTSDCSYRNNLSDILGQLCTVGQRETNGTGTIIVQADENLAGVRYSRSNGAPAQYGWFGKKTASGHDAYCIEFGVPLNMGENTGYDIHTDKSEKGQKASLAGYYGYYLQKTLPNKFYTESLINEIINGQTTTIYSDDLGQVSQAGYEAFKKDVMAKVNTFYVKPSFANETVTLKAGEIKTLTDKNGSLAYYEVAKDKANVDAKIQGNQLILTGKKDSKEQAGIILRYKIDSAYQKPHEYWENPYLQKNFICGTGDPTNFEVKVNVLKKGDVKIKKVDKTTGKAVPGTKFHVVFSGEDAPKAQDVTVGSDGTATLKDIMQGVHVKATETFVPAPYVLGSTVGDSDVVEGDVVANQTITLTQRNQKETGQIVVDKAGTESEKKMWNGNYSLAGNVFEIHEGTKTGQVVRTITTDEDGHAETGKDLPLGIYWVTEKQASQGFVRTFEPVEVKIEYGNQKVPVVVKEATGKNQEVVGSSTLTKEDAETGNEPQGSASFVGAEYALFHEDGTPVKWSEAFNPVLTHGTKVKDEDNAIVIRIDEKDQKAGVAHLALGKYKWREVKAPIGYQIDQTDRTFELTYKDQETKVVVSDVISQEKAIKFVLDGFKYVKSKSGSTETGYNGIELKLSPLKGTKGKVQTTTTKTDDQGYDGYWKFDETPIGDYKLEEVKAPEGFQLITPLTIQSDFNEKTREYTFTLMEEGQEEPLKVIKKTEQEINEGSNVLHLNKLFLYDDHVKVPEKPEITTLFTTTKGEKTFNPTVDQTLIDRVDNQFDPLDVGRTFYYVAQFHKIDKNGKDTVVDTVESEHKVEKETFRFNVEHAYKANTLQHGEKLVATYIIYTDKEHKNEYARHFDLSNEKQTLEAVTPEKPLIETLFLTKNGGKTFDPTVDNELIDEVKATVSKEDIGKTFYYVTQFHKIDKNGKVTVVGTEESEHKAGERTYEFKAVYHYKANTLKDGEKLVATQIAYTDKEHKNEYVKHFDLKNEKQTLTAKTPVTPATPTISQKLIPQTSGSLVNIGSLILLGIAAIAGTTLYVATKKKENQNEK